MKIKKGFMKRKIGDKYLVVTTGELARSNSMFIELNETSNEIWDYVEKGYDEEIIASRLSKKYGISHKKALSDTKKLLSEMEQAGIFE
jgi:hypothetical protein